MDRTTSWLRDRIAECSPGPGRGLELVDKLAVATESIWRANGMVFGMVLPPRLSEREPILAECAAVLRDWLPRIADTAVLQRLAAMERRTNLQLDTAPYVAALVAKTEAALAARRAAAAKIEPRNEALEHAIDEHPDDPGGYSVLADWLEAQGSARGALIHLGLRAETDPVTHAQIASYIAAHRNELLGELDEVHHPHLRWRRGFIDGARLSADHSITQDLERLLQHPSGRRLAELSIGMSGESQEFTLSEITSVIAAERPKHLRSLYLGDFTYPDETEMSWYDVGDVSVLWTLPALTKLIVQGGSFTLGTIDGPLLEHAEFRTGGLTTESALAIANATWPKLQRLDVWFGAGGYGGDATLLDIRALLARRDLTQLRHLGLMNSENSDAICELLVTSPLSPQLEVLDLSLGTLGDEGVRVLLANGDRFQKLQRLIVSNSWVSDPLIAELEAWGPSVIADDMNEPAELDDRYVSVGE